MDWTGLDWTGVFADLQYFTHTPRTGSSGNVGSGENKRQVKEPSPASSPPEFNNNDDSPEKVHTDPANYVYRLWSLGSGGDGSSERCSSSGSKAANSVVLCWVVLTCVCFVFVFGVC